MINTILIFIMSITIVIVLYKVNKNVKILITYAQKNINEKQETRNVYEEKEDTAIIDNVIKELIFEKNESSEKYIKIDEFTILSYKESIEYYKNKSTCYGCRFLERHDESNIWGEVEHHWYCTEYKKYIVKNHGSLAWFVKPICKNNKELMEDYKELVDRFDELYNKHTNNR